MTVALMMLGMAQMYLPLSQELRPTQKLLLSMFLAVMDWQLKAMFLQLVIDRDLQVAFTRQAETGDLMGSVQIITHKFDALVYAERLGGFGDRGSEGKIRAIEYARETLSVTCDS